MISQLRGILLEATMSQAVIDVGGVGYEVGISGTTAAALPQAVKAIEMAASKGVYHKNNAARKVSRISKAVNSIA